MNVNFDDIEIMAPDYGGGTVFYHNNKPFTGTIVEYNSNNVLVGEITVVNGSTHGKVTLYFDNGNKMEEHFESYNRPYGLSRKWDENGNLIKQVDFGAENHP